VSSRVLRIATRASQLALWQANWVASRLKAVDADQDVELVHVTTTGDRIHDASLSALGGVGVFTREIQQALLDDRADLAVHSLKDLPTVPVDGLSLAAVPERASPWDALILPAGSRTPELGLEVLSPNARVGTGSLRRRAQLLFLRPDLEFVEIRGNVDTRLRKLDAGEANALILAEAGLDRLGLSSRISARLAPPELFPAVGQGALGLECRTDDAATRQLVGQLNHAATFACVTAERHTLARLGAGCHAPVGTFTSVENEELTLEAVALDRDGRQRVHAKRTGRVTDSVAIADEVADALCDQGADDLIAPTQ
jgi:hydroxymethylbilane synthase